jgi:hypothetical protein
MDSVLFGRPFCALFSEAYPHTLFAEVMAFFYLSYYLIIPGMGLLLWFRKRPAFEPFLFQVALCFYFFYGVFSLFPSAGPQYHLYDGAIAWDGVFFGPVLTELLLALEVPTGAFPSSHVGLALIVFFTTLRHQAWAGLPMAILLTGLCAAILYGGPHYFLDLPCGLAVGAVFLWLSRPCGRKIDGWLRAVDSPIPP